MLKPKFVHGLGAETTASVLARLQGGQGEGIGPLFPPSDVPTGDPANNPAPIWTWSLG